MVMEWTPKLRCRGLQGMPYPMVTALKIYQCARILLLFIRNDAEIYCSNIPLPRFFHSLV